MPHVDFTHLHCHTQFSLLDSTCKIKDLIKRAVELKMPAIAMTDNGNLFGALAFYSEAMKQGIKPIIGMSAYIAPGSRFEKQSHGIKEASFHLTLLARNEKGYKNLMKLSSAGYTEGFYYRPRIDKELLAECSEGLIGMTGGLKGEIPHNILHEQIDGAKKALQEFIDIFGKENFYLEVMDHGLEPEKKLNEAYVDLGKEFGVGLVVSNDVHYIHQKDALAHDALICIGTGSAIEDERRFRYEGDQYYLKSAVEMQKLFKQYPEALRNTMEIANRCNLEFEFGKFHLPPFKAPDGVENPDYLEQLCRDLLVKRIKTELDDVYEKRLVYELEVITNMGYVNYFLIVWDFIHYAKKNGIPVGPGRGSAAGSLVAYALGITDIDPIVHGLIFERFLNPDRVSMPDIDIDFCYERRDEVIEYVRRFYGYENVAQIITFGTMAAKAAVRDVSRVMSFNYADADRIAKLIPNELNITIKSAITKEPKLKELIATDARVKQLIDTSMALEGLARHCSTHAAGVVISDKPLTEYVALFKTGEQISTQFGMKDVEKIGLLKMDFLGLKTLTMISKAIKLIEKTKGVKVDLDTLPLDDEKTYELLARAEAAGVFQLESSGMRDLLKKMKPSKFDHIVALLALYRPGPLGSGMVDDFIQRMHKPSLIKYDHQLLEAALEETYGVILYQEQVMKIVSDMAGFSLAQSDSLRRAIGKKIPEVMEEEKKNFVDGSMKNGVKQKVAEKIWNLIDYFSGYGFNKSHSTAYALISYQTAYLKAHHPLEFMTALLSNEMGNAAKVVRYIDEAKKMGLEVLPPSVNESYPEFTCADNHIRFGLTAVKNVGSTAIDSIIQNREKEGPYKTFFDFTDRVDLRVCNRKVLESLIRSGCCDDWGFFRSQLMATVDRALESGSAAQKDRSLGQMNFFQGGDGDDSFNQGTQEMPDIEEWPENQLLAYERELLGFYVTSHPLSQYSSLLQQYATATTDTLSDFKDQEEVTLGGIIEVSKEILTKKGDKMAFVELQDLSGACEVIVFPKTYEVVSSVVVKDATVFIKGKINLRDDVPKIIAEEIIPLKDVRSRFTQAVSIDLMTAGLEPELLKQIKIILMKHKGPVPVYMRFRNPAGKTAVVDSGDDLKVDTSDELFAELKQLLGEGIVKIR